MQKAYTGNVTNGYKPIGLETDYVRLKKTQCYQSCRGSKADV